MQQPIPHAELSEGDQIFACNKTEKGFRVIVAEVGAAGDLHITEIVEADTVGTALEAIFVGGPDVTANCWVAAPGEGEFFLGTDTLTLTEALEASVSSEALPQRVVGWTPPTERNEQ